MSRMQGSNANVNFPQHGDAEGVNPGNAPSVSATLHNFSGAQTIPSAPTRHLPVVNHQRAVPNSPISPPLDPRDGILNYLVHQGLLNSDLSLRIDHQTLRNVLSSTRNNSQEVPITSMPQISAIPRLATPECRQIQTVVHLLLTSVLQMMRRHLVIRLEMRPQSTAHESLRTAITLCFPHFPLLESIFSTIQPTRIVQTKISPIINVHQTFAYHLRLQFLIRDAHHSR